MKLYPTKLMFKLNPIWIEADNEVAAEGIEYAASMDRVMLALNETDREPIDLDKKEETNE